MCHCVPNLLVCGGQVWRHWKERYQENVVQRVKSAVAERHWVVRQQAGCWTAWAMYVERRRRKKHLNGVSHVTQDMHILLGCV